MTTLRYEAVDRRSGEHVLLLAPVDDSAASIRAFARDARRAAALSHPGLTTTRSRDSRLRGQSLPAGETLSAWLADFPDGAPLTLVRGWARELAATLDYLHDHGVAGVDLRASNLLVTADLHLVLLDALAPPPRPARSRRPGDGTDGDVAGLSPQQLQGRPGDKRSDLYAWGALVYRLVSGRAPFPASSRLGALTAPLRVEPAPPGSLRADVPEGLDLIVRRTLRRLPEHRYPSAAALLTDLDRLERLRRDDFDLAPEPALSAVSVLGRDRPLWLLVGGVAVGFWAVLAASVGLALLLR